MVASVPVTTGLDLAAPVCAFIGLAGLIALRDRLRSVAGLLVASAIVTSVVGQVVASLVARPSVPLASTYVLSMFLLIVGLLGLPGLAPSFLMRARRVVDGLILALCLFYTGWTLVLEPVHARQFGRPVADGMDLEFLLMIGPAIATVSALSIATVVVVRAVKPRRSVLCAAGSVSVAAVGGAALHSASHSGSEWLIIVASIAMAGGQLGVVLGSRAIQPDATPADRPDEHGIGLSVIPLTLPLTATVVRLVAIGPLDGVSVILGTAIGVGIAVQQFVARRDIRSYARRLVESEAHFRAMAHTDSLTGLGNRRLLLQRLYEDAVGGPPCALFAIDLDGFKNVNDMRGHDVGDAVLIEVGRRLKVNVRPGDLAIRMGGDEFSVLVWAGPDEAMSAADRLLNVLAQPYELETGTLFLSVSIGLAGCQSADDIPTLLRNADLALRFAKQRGKNRVECYDEAYDLWVRRRTELADELRGAAERGELMLAYQPVVTVPGGRVAGVEALLRWHHPIFGQVGPDEFIPVAEESGLIHGIGEFVLDEASHQLARWVADGHDVWLSVNVSVRELHEPGYADRVAAVLRRRRLPAGRLVIEVTEHAVAEDLAQVIDLLTALRDAGVRVALDDFGAGYSSLAHLRALPVDILKIDRQLLESEIIDVVVRFGQRLGLDVVAEGVTGADQLRVLEDAGCTYAQGLLLGRSMPAERVETLFGVQNLGSVDSAHEMRQS
jgi:diguanylate cyclase (GGDEF)-like protein